MGRFWEGFRNIFGSFGGFVLRGWSYFGDVFSKFLGYSLEETKLQKKHVKYKLEQHKDLLALTRHQVCHWAVCRPFKGPSALSNFDTR